MGLLDELAHIIDPDKKNVPATGSYMPALSAEEHIPGPAAGAVQHGQTPGHATPDTHPQHFTDKEGPRLPAGPWTPNTGVGESAQHGYAPPPISRRLDEYDIAQDKATHVVPVPEKGLPREPVPVYVVAPDTGPDSLTVTSGHAVTVGATPVRILSRDPHRAQVILTNMGATASDWVRIGPQNAVTPSQGAPLAIGQPYVLHGQEAVYACVDANATDQSVTLSIVVEYGSTGPGKS